MKTIVIQAPVAKPNDIVWVQNYRSHRKDEKEVWEQGTVSSVKYELGYEKWSYDVRTIRKTARGYSVDLYVGDDKISKKKPV